MPTPDPARMLQLCPGTPVIVYARTTFSDKRPPTVCELDATRLRDIVSACIFVSFSCTSSQDLP